MKTVFSLVFLLMLAACTSLPRQPIANVPGSMGTGGVPATPTTLGRIPAPDPADAGKPLLERRDVQVFISEMVTQHRFDGAELQAVFGRAQLQPSIIAAMSKPAESKPWHAYRPLFLNAKRIQGGVAFWRTHAAALARAEQVYGVPPEYVVAIIGVETQYGGNMGNYRVLEALATLAFGYPRRADYFRKELENFLLLARAEGIDPLALRGSYAGAMGYGQFMPTSFLSFAVDFDGDGHRDLWRNPRDAIGSVAHYFNKHGWQPGQPVASPALVSGSRYPALISRKLDKPQYAIANLRSQGVAPQAQVDEASNAMLLEFQGINGPEYWLGFDNFYVISRYNRSQLYAMAVYQLSQGIRAHYAQSSASVIAPMTRVADTD